MPAPRLRPLVLSPRAPRAVRGGRLRPRSLQRLLRLGDVAAAAAGGDAGRGAGLGHLRPSRPLLLPGAARRHPHALHALPPRGSPRLPRPGLGRRAAARLCRLPRDRAVRRGGDGGAARARALSRPRRPQAAQPLLHLRVPRRVHGRPRRHPAARRKVLLDRPAAGRGRGAHSGGREPGGQVGRGAARGGRRQGSPPRPARPARRGVRLRSLPCPRVLAAARPHRQEVPSEASLPLGDARAADARPGRGLPRPLLAAVRHGRLGQAASGRDARDLGAARLDAKDPRLLGGAARRRGGAAAVPGGHLVRGSRGGRGGDGQASRRLRRLRERARRRPRRRGGAAPGACGAARGRAALHGPVLHRPDGRAPDQRDLGQARPQGAAEDAARAPLFRREQRRCAGAAAAHADRGCGGQGVGRGARAAGCDGRPRGVLLRPGGALPPRDEADRRAQPARLPGSARRLPLRAPHHPRAVRAPRRRRSQPRGQGPAHAPPPHRPGGRGDGPGGWHAGRLRLGSARVLARRLSREQAG
mmetsp:Transcript_47507/g.158358  ORF Transcript_47507/g.158358 Transcript_47507/m.158358 type:complete len:529 (+) Transcript_47507:607-2193(+)